MTDFVELVTTAASREAAERIARPLVERRLVACAQISGPIHSAYRWRGQVESADEWRCAVKTRLSLVGEVERAIRELHDYETPEIVVTRFEHVSDAYRAWLDTELKRPERDAL